MLVTTLADALHLLRLILDTPSHKGDERGGAEVQGGPGSAGRGSDRTQVARDGESVGKPSTVGWRSTKATGSRARLTGLGGRRIVHTQFRLESA